jgi:hypothetical protein
VKAAKRIRSHAMDCFDVTDGKRERLTHVRISVHRNAVIVDVKSDGDYTGAEISLWQLAWLLKHADKLKRDV